MKKNIFCMVLTMLFIGIVNAQDISSEMNQTLTMPTDEEIMQIINKYNFSEAQKQQIFKSTKESLQQMISDGIDLNNLQKNTTNLNKTETDTTPQDGKKYTKHSKLGPQRD